MKILVIFLIFLISLAFSIETSDLNSSCSGIDHCITCHRGNTYVFWVCDQCDPTYGIDTKYDSSDLCIYCDSVIPHCVECSNPEDAWGCNKCEDGYKLIIVPFQDDVCAKESGSLSFLA